MELSEHNDGESDGDLDTVPRFRLVPPEEAELDWGAVLRVLPQRLLLESATEPELAELQRVGELLKHTALRDDGSAAPEEAARRFLRAAQLLQLVAQCDAANAAADLQEAYLHSDALQAELERVRSCFESSRATH